MTCFTLLYKKEGRLVITEASGGSIVYWMGIGPGA